jgi:glycine/D-amino acid oxidase-like deaminating enzyme
VVRCAGIAFVKGIFVVTKSKDLRTGRSVWLNGRAPSLPHGPLTRDIETDVLIIGAGITGAMIADALCTAGRKVVLADTRGPARGSTSASTALVQYEIDTPLSVLVGKIGKRDAVRAWRRSRLAVDALAARLDELRVRDVVRRDTLYLTGDELDAAGMAREYQARLAAGFAARLLDRKVLRMRFGISRPAALLCYGDLAIDPFRTTLALLRAACEQGARIFAPARIVDLVSNRNEVTATAANGRQIRCQHVVYATGYELPHDVPRRGHQIVSTWAIATVRQPRRLWPGECMIWEASDPYLYLRTTPDGRVICGGEDEEFSDAAARDALLPQKTRTLRRKLRRLLPGVDTTVEFAWCGSFGASSTGLPRNGRVPGRPRTWVALGYGGNGTTYSRIAADVICGAITARPDVDADLYDFPQN